MKNLKQVGIFLILLSLFSSCKKDDTKIRKYDIKGFAQKGPFQTGSIITISELDKDLKPTGRNFYTTVTDNYGSYNISDIELSTTFIELMADGYYYNERSGIVSDDRFVLKSLVDISNSETFNINTLTDISVERIKYLVQTEKKNFKEAKEQTQNEVLSIFNLNANGSSDFEILDISKQGEYNNELLTISSILQSIKKVSVLRSFLSNLSSDLKEDGDLDSEDIQTDIITSACLLDFGSIRKNLNTYYKDTVTRDIQKYCRQFVDSSEFTPMVKLNFPESGISMDYAYLDNVLYLQDNATIKIDKYYSVTPNLINNSLITNGLKLNQLELKIIQTTPQYYNNNLQCNKANNLTNWSYSTYNESFISDNLTYTNIGFLFWLSNPSNLSTSDVAKILVKGTGELKVTITLTFTNPQNAYINEQITKFIKW
jgi:hypothetical protein